MALLGDFLFLRPTQPATGRRFALGALGVIAAVSALIAAFAFGRHTQTEPTSYPFLIIESMTLVKAGPIAGSETAHSFEDGETVEVDCELMLDGKRWYRLADLAGWLNEDDAVPAPHAGKGSPSDCPN